MTLSLKDVRCFCSYCSDTFNVWRDIVNYLRQGGYVFDVACLFVCLLATLRKNFRTDLHEILRVDKRLN